MVYMHKFYVLHLFTVFHHGEMAEAYLFLVCKVENEEEIIKMHHRCLKQPSLDTKSEVSEVQTIETQLFSCMMCCLFFICSSVTISETKLHQMVIMIRTDVDGSINGII
jgi:hypothetical protein